MQTFLTHDNYLDTAKILDYKRLGKQRVEAYQIFKALRGDYHRSKGWINHPATAMWRGFEYQLALYGLTISQEFLDRGYNGQRMVEIFTQLATQAFAQDKQNPPWWVQSKLLQKHTNPIYYGKILVIILSIFQAQTICLMCGHCPTKIHIGLAHLQKGIQSVWQ